MQIQTTCKRITTKSFITHNNIEYPINNGGGRKLGLYTEQLHKMINQFQVAYKKWGRTLMIRFDLHTEQATPSNILMTSFRNKLEKKLKRRYPLDEIGYCWAREFHGDAKGEHFHWVLFLNGNVINYPAKIIPLIHSAWSHPAGGFTAHLEKQHYLFIDSTNLVMEAVYWMSYLAKTQGKLYRSKQTKDYSTSRIKAPKTTET
ncbi:MAG: inovirus-type Gp2 protein [Methylococcales bacterium]